MTKHDLERLKDLPVPAPSSGAKARALGAAMAAFNDAQPENEDQPQGNSAKPRPTHVTSIQPRRRIMRSTPSRYAIAASVAAMAVSLPVLLHFMNNPKFHQASAPLTVSETVDKFSAAGRRDDKPNTERKVTKSEVVKPRAPQRIAANQPKAQPEPKAKPKSGSEADRILGQLRQRENRMRREAEKARGLFADGKKLAAQVPAEASRSASGALLSDQFSASGSSSVARPVPRVRFRFKGSQKMVAAPGLSASRIMPTGHDRLPPAPQYKDRDQFEHVASNPIKQVAEHPVSTFSVDVDTASYAVVRRWLNQGKLPPKDAVRVEELINYFNYNYARPESASEPFKTTVNVVPSPWAAERQLVHIGIKGYELASTERPRANLVFLIDVSGSMRGQGRLALLKNAFKMLLDNMRPDDTVGIVTYASGTGVALEPTKVSAKHKIIAAIDRLGAGGSTAGAQGIQDAYRLAQSAFDSEAVNRVILGTDGDFNVGISDRKQLKGFIERKRKTGIFLSILGVGKGNYNDALMQTLAQNGNGTAAYIDTLNEARKVLVEEASSTLFPIAKDVKIQFEFNPAQVRDYRLIGYETRALKRQDFNNDKVDAGDVGSGHAVTAIYEVTPVGAKTRTVDALRYQQPKPKPVPARRRVAAPDDGKSAELGFLKLRYKLPDQSVSRLMTMPIKSMPIKTADNRTSLDQVSKDVRFAIAVAAFGQLLRGETSMSGYSYDDVIKLANGARGPDPFGLRAEFVNLVRLAKSAQK